MFPGSFLKMNVGLLSMNREMCVKKDARERLRREKKTKEAEQEQQEMKLIQGYYLFHIQ